MHSVKLLISPCRSGSTAFIHAFSQNPEIRCIYQPVKAGLRAGRGADHSVFRIRARTGYLMAKETLGHLNAAECEYPLFPNRRAMRESRPVFLLRDPLETYNAWKTLGWGSLELFELAFGYVLVSIEQVRDAGAPSMVITYDELMQAPRRIIREVCAHWGMPFIEEMMDWSTPFTKNERILYPDPTHGNYDEAHGHVSSVRTFTRIRREQDLTLEEKRRLNPLVQRYWSTLLRAPANSGWHAAKPLVRASSG